MMFDNKKLRVIAIVMLVMLAWNPPVAAQESTEMVTITIDATDDNEGLLYAIDSMEDTAFSSSNTFMVEPGSEHIIYVKDMAGNITSQKYIAPSPEPANEKEEMEVVSMEQQELSTDSVQEHEVYSVRGNISEERLPEGEEPRIDIDIDFEEEEEKKNKNYEYITDTVVSNMTEEPDTYVQSKTTTDGTDTAEKVFYTIETQEGEQFYMVIDQGASNKVYFLNRVTISDLAALAEKGDENTKKEKKEKNNLLQALRSEDAATQTLENNTDATSQKTKRPSLGIILVLALAGGGIYYYVTVYKKKKDESMDVMDALDLDDFEMEEEKDEGEELDFDSETTDDLIYELMYGEEEAEREEKNIQHEDSKNEAEESGKKNVEYENTDPEENNESASPAAGYPDMNEMEKEEIERIRKEMEEMSGYDPDLDGEE